MSTRLNIGCGFDKRDGYINLDANPDVDPDMVSDAISLPFDEGSVDEVYAQHLIEHLYPWDAEVAVLEWRRVLKPGGKLVVLCPDLEKVCKWMAERNDYDSFSRVGMGGLYGRMRDRNPYMGHRWGYTKSSLTFFLETLGFVDIQFAAGGNRNRDLKVTAAKRGDGSFRSSPLRVCWFIHADESIGSARYQGYRVHDFFRSQGIATDLVYAPGHTTDDIPWQEHNFDRVLKAVGNDIAVFHKCYGQRTQALMKLLTSCGAKTVYISCDCGPHDATAVLADRIVCPSTNLAEHYRRMGHGDVICIPDPPEFWVTDRSNRDRYAEKNELTLCWIGNRAHWGTLDPVREMLKSPQFQHVKLLTVSNHPEATVQWSLVAVREALDKADIGIVPTGMSYAQSLKSANRVVLFMAAGVPVIAGRLDSYVEVIDPGVNGLLFSSGEEMRRALESLMDAGTRQRIADAAFKSVMATHAPDKLKAMWLEAFTAVNERRRPSWGFHGSTAAERTHAARELVIENVLYETEQRRKSGGADEAWQYYLNRMQALRYDRSTLDKMRYWYSLRCRPRLRRVLAHTPVAWRLLREHRAV